jgi:hypothetical protein
VTPTNPQVLYAGTKYGGVLKTTDGRATRKNGGQCVVSCVIYSWENR